MGGGLRVGVRILGWEVRIFVWWFYGGGEDIRVGGEDIRVAVLGWGVGCVSVAPAFMLDTWVGYLLGQVVSCPMITMKNAYRQSPARRGGPSYSPRPL